MKVIDLLNKIANGEEVPKGIKHNGDLYLWEKNDKTYYSEPNGADLMAYIDIPNELNDEIEIIEEQENILTISEEQFLFNQLNYEDTMEIIELMKKKIYKKKHEDKKIEKLDLRGYYDRDIQDESEWLTGEETMVIKINELIDEVNKLKGEKNE